MTEPKPYLHETLAFYDAVQLKVLSNEAPQNQVAQLLTAYTARHGVARSMQGKHITFVHGPSSWGNDPLAPGETAIAFLHARDHTLYEKPFHGHYVIEDIDGEPHAIIPHLNTEGSRDEIIIQSRQDPRRPYARAIKLSSLEAYIATVNAAFN